MPWTKTETGWCTEISDLPSRLSIQLPNSPIHCSLLSFAVKRDPEGDIMYWEKTIGGVEYIIFND